MFRRVWNETWGLYYVIYNYIDKWRERRGRERWKKIYSQCQEIQYICGKIYVKRHEWWGKKLNNLACLKRLCKLYIVNIIRIKCDWSLGSPLARARGSWGSFDTRGHILYHQLCILRSFIVHWHLKDFNLLDIILSWIDQIWHIVSLGNIGKQNREFSCPFTQAKDSTKT